tara:strand:- start:173 stop:1888 length:1716 start_codon:yes stop_codon:yes gene_type:complete
MDPVERHARERVRLFKRKKELDRSNPRVYFDKLLAICSLEQVLDREFLDGFSKSPEWYASRGVFRRNYFYEDGRLGRFINAEVGFIDDGWEINVMNIEEVGFLLTNYDVVKSLFEPAVFPTAQMRLLSLIADLRFYLESGLEGHDWFNNASSNYDLFFEELNWRDPRELYNSLLNKLTEEVRIIKDVNFVSDILQILMRGRPLQKGESVPLGDLIKRQGFSLIDPSIKEVMLYDLDVQYPEGEPLKRVLVDVAQTFFKRVVIKKPKKIVPLSEFGSWIYSHPQKRLKRDMEFAKYFSRLVNYGALEGFDSVKPIAFDYEQSVYVQEVLDGTRLIDLPSHEEQVEAVNVLVRRLADFHKIITQNIGSFPQKLPKVNYLKELRAIGSLCGWKGMRKVVRAYKPFLRDLKPSVVCHNSLHHKNVFVVKKEGAMIFPFLDFELVAYACQQDDLVRLIEGPIKFGYEEKMGILAAYYLGFYAGAYDFVYPVEGITRTSYDWSELLSLDPDFEQFCFVYHLRRTVLHHWAHSYLSSKGVPNADQQVEKSFQSLGEMRKFRESDKRIDRLESALLSAI